MKKKPQKPKKPQITAVAKCATFDVEITANLKTRNLTKEEVDDVKRKLKDQISRSVASLPFAHVYPHEVTFL